MTKKYDGYEMEMDQSTLNIKEKRERTGYRSDRGTDGSDSFLLSVVFSLFSEFGITTALNKHWKA